jgi:hypothetical protein
MSKNSAAAPCRIVVEDSAPGAVGDACSPHDTITTAADNAKIEAATLGEDISSPDSSRVQHTSRMSVGQKVNHELK